MARMGQPRVHSVPDMASVIILEHPAGSADISREREDVFCSCVHISKIYICKVQVCSMISALKLELCP